MRFALRRFTCWRRPTNIAVNASTNTIRIVDVLLDVLLDEPVPLFRVAVGRDAFEVAVPERFVVELECWEVVVLA